MVGMRPILTARPATIKLRPCQTNTQNPLMGHDNTYRTGQGRVSRIGMAYRDTTPEMLARALAAIESRLAVVLEVAEREARSPPGSGKP